MKEAVIVASSRTPIGKAWKGSLNMTRPDDMVAMCIQNVLGKVEGLDPAEVEDVIIGTSIPEAESGLQLGRYAAVLAGLPVTVAGNVINRACASGLNAIVDAVHSVRDGAEVVIGGGVESISMVQNKMNLDGMINPKLKETKPGMYYNMGQTAEIVAKRYNITREMQDEFAVLSQERTARAQAEGKFSETLFPVRGKRGVKNEDGSIDLVDFELPQDEGNRPGTTLEGLAGLKPVFDEKGTVTAGNASQFSDGASVAVVMSEGRAKDLGAKPLGRLVSYCVAGCEPDEMGVGPSVATPKLLKRLGMSLDDIDLIELHEAFASQAVYCRNKLGMDPDKVNVNGGAISVGHPYGMSGARMVGNLLHELRRRNGKYGLVTMCMGGGQGAAAVFESMN